MIRPGFLGAGLATSMGTGVAANVAGARLAPAPPRYLERRVDGRTELIPYKLLDDFPLASPGARLASVVATVVDEALHEACVGPADLRDMALCVGSSSFDICASEAAYRAERAAGGAALPLRSSSVANVAESIRDRFGIRGEDYSFHTACTASANGLWYGARLVRSGRAARALIVGVELINDLTALGFAGLGLLTRDAMRPFDSRRDGLVLGEACCALVVGESDPDRFHWRGGASTCDTHSMVAPAADGSSVADVIGRALADAALAPAQIDAIKAHGTANPANDDAESAGLRRAFASLPPVCAVKPFIGHTLGASGLAELIIVYRSIEAGFLIGTPGIADEDTPSGLALNQRPLPMRGGTFLVNSFGFGGSNTSLVVARA
jgi:3-oxoacyl-[acyl-carrier-protein] synthase-1